MEFWHSMNWIGDELVSLCIVCLPCLYTMLILLESLLFVNGFNLAIYMLFTGPAYSVA